MYNYIWIIYVKNNCKYSEKAKQLCNKHNIDVSIIEVNKSNKKKIYNDIDSLTNNYRLFPIVFKNDIFIGGYSALEKELENKLIIPQGNNTEQTKFDGSPWYSLVAMIYLSNKHNQDCIVIPKDKLNIPKKQSEISLRWDENEQNIRIPKDFWIYFNRCNGKKRFIVFPFGFSCKNISHANYIIYDSRNKTMERFEPYGDIKNFVNYKNIKCLMVDIDREILKLFTEKFGVGYITKYYKPLDYMTNKGFQTIQESEINEIKKTDPNGFCTSWCVWYTDLRLSNPNIERKKLITLAIETLKKRPESLTRFIRNYCEFLVSQQDLVKIKLNI